MSRELIVVEQLRPACARLSSYLERSTDKKAEVEGERLCNFL
jgi:hypothetical protein